MDVNDIQENHGCSSQIAPAVRVLIVRFRVGGLLRFLSHAEMMRVFQRAFARAGVPVKYTAGFNPHPRLSLPLPRTVGVESEDDLLAARLSVEPAIAGGIGGSQGLCADRLRQMLQEALPAGIEVLHVEIMEGSVSFRARSAGYAFVLRPDRVAGSMNRLGERAQAVLAGERWTLERKLPGDRRVRRIDVRPFLQSIQTADDRVTVRCNITAAGSIRIDEIMQLLELRTEDLAAPIRRTSVEWVSTQPPRGDKNETG